MLLDVKHRLLLLNILPQQGNAVTLRLLMKQQELLSFTEEEHKALGFRSSEGSIEWKHETDTPVDIPIGEVVTGIIVTALKALDTQNKLKPEFLPLYDYFVEGEDWHLNSDAAEATSGSGAEPILIKQPKPRTTKEVLGSRPAAEGSKD